LDSEHHISSLVVQGRPEALPAIRAAIQGLAGAEVPLDSPNGKLVVTLETADEHEILKHIDTIGRLDGVMSTALVFHHVERLTDPTAEQAAAAEPPSAQG